jgi:phage repressor protein C with HTH and peptisase S24 domain
MATVIIDVSRRPSPNDIVIALVNGVMYVKRLMFDKEYQQLKDKGLL